MNEWAEYGREKNVGNKNELLCTHTQAKEKQKLKLMTAMRRMSNERKKDLLGEKNHSTDSIVVVYEFTVQASTFTIIIINCNNKNFNINRYYCYDCYWNWN